MDKAYFVTLTGLSHYYGFKPFKVGRIVKLIKDTENEYDDEAIMAYLPMIDKVGYVANSPKTVYQGTVSAGRLYDKIEDYAYARIMFITHSSAIALVLDKDDVEEIDEDENDDEDTDNEPVIEVKPKKKSDKKHGNKKGKIGFAI